MIALPVSTEDVGGNLLQLGFYGDSTAENQKALGRVHLVTKYPQTDTPTFFVATPILNLDLYFGTGTGVASGPIDGLKAVDRIDIVDDFSPTPPGARVIGNMDNALAILEFDIMGATHVIVELRDNDQSNSIGCIWRVLT